MAAMTDYLESNLIDHVLRGATGGTAFPQPANVYLALYPSATPPTDAGGGTELTGGSYARQVVTFKDPAGGGATENAGVINFTNMPAATVSHCAIFDALTGGNMLLHGALTTQRTTSAGDTLSFADGALDVTLA